jgi:hypothetical protein
MLEAIRSLPKRSDRGKTAHETRPSMFNVFGKECDGLVLKIMELRHVLETDGY